MGRTLQALAAFVRATRAYIYDRDNFLHAVFDESKNLGGVYIKFLQQIASSEHMVGKTDSLVSNLDVYDRVATETIDVEGLLSGELGNKAREFTILNEGTPIAAGSFAQVYLAQHHQLGMVIIKILRPSVIKNLNTDLRLLKIVSHLLQPFMSNGLINMPKLAKEFIDSTKREINYREEARLATYLKSYYEERSSPIYIPSTYEAYTTMTLLVQEYMDGVKLSDVIINTQTGNDPKEYVSNLIGSDLYIQLENLGAELVSSLFFADYIMADPHPGNIILLPNNRVALIDFGLIAPAPTRRSAFFSLIQQYRAIYEKTSDLPTLTLAMLAFFDYELYDALRVCSQTLGFSMTNIRDVLARHAIPKDIYSSRNFVDLSLTWLFLEDINTNNRFAIQINANDVLVQKAMHVYASSLNLVCYDRDTYKTIFYNGLVRADNEGQRRGIQERRSNRKELTPDKAREIVMEWLVRMAEKNEVMFINLTKEIRV